MTSSISPMPRSTSPSATSDSPTPTRARTTRSGSANLLPISAARSYALQSRVRVAQRHALGRCRDEQVPRLDPLAASLVDQSLRAGEPAGGRRHLASAEMLDGNPEGTANGPRRIAGTDRIPVRPARELHALRVFADEVGRDGEALEILGAERCLTIGSRQQVAGVRPRLAVVRSPTAVQGGVWRSRSLRHRSSFDHRRSGVCRHPISPVGLPVIRPLNGEDHCSACGHEQRAWWGTA